MKIKNQKIIPPAVLTALLIFQIIAGVLFLPPIEQVEAAWLSGYSFRKKITITGQTGAGTYYQVKLLIGESSGATGQNFDLNSHCSSFPNDIRFTDNDQITPLDYWVESTTGTTPNQLSTVWVEVKDSLESGTVDIYIYYGKSGESSASNGISTFEFFDDFATNNVNPNGDSRWTWQTGATHSYSVSDGKIRITPSANTWPWTGTEPPSVVSANSFSGNIAIQVKMVNRSLDYYGGQVFYKDTDEYIAWDLDGNPAGAGRIIQNNAGTETTSVTTAPGTTYPYYALITKVSNTYTVYSKQNIGDSWVQRGSWTPSPAISPTKAGIGCRGYTNKWFDFDDLLVRKYASPEPSFSSAGSEENSSLGAMYSLNYRIPSSSINIGGHYQTSTTGYKMRDTIGEIATGLLTSSPSGYKVDSGYQALIGDLPVLIFSISDNTAELGLITTSAASIDSTTFSVATNAGSGYVVDISGTTLTSGSDTIDALITPTTSSPGTEQFGINLVANTSPLIGADPLGGSGQAGSGYNTTNNFKFVSGNTIASCSGFSNATTFTISYLGNISNSTVAGDYSTTLTLIVTGTF